MTLKPRHKCPLKQFLSQNPMPDPWGSGFFYREKMRAIHRVAPDTPFSHILEVGGGESGLTALLYPQARVTNLDMDSHVATSPVNLGSGVFFINGNAQCLPFKTHSFDAVTLLDVLEHVPQDDIAVSEVLRVLRPEGSIIISAPNQRWRFPHYKIMKGICPSSKSIRKTWGHVRKGYSPSQIEALFGSPIRASESYINPLTAPVHDLAFSFLSKSMERVFCLLLAPMTLVGYTLSDLSRRGSETAMRL